MADTDPTTETAPPSEAPMTPGTVRWFTSTIEVVASGKLALALIAALMAFAAAGAMLPQEGRMAPADILAWQVQHPTVSSYADAIGLFHVFGCWPFLVTIIVLSVNTLTCTVLSLSRQDWFRGLRGWMMLRRTGFVALHLSLLLLFAGGFLSAAADLDGKVYLTEGQEFVDAKPYYYQLHTGPLRRAPHTHQQFRLKEVDVQYEQRWYVVGVRSTLEVLEDDEPIEVGTVEVNYPFTYGGLSFTQDENGFAPRLAIRHTARNMMMADSFVALKSTFKDVLPLPYSKQKIEVTLLPDYVRDGGEVRKVSDMPDKPLLLVDVTAASGEVVEHHELPLGGEVEIGQFTLAFPELRRWSSFRVSDDPGYPWVCAALWIGLVAMLLRYTGDIRTWIREWSEGSREVGDSCRPLPHLPLVVEQAMMRAEGCRDSAL